MAERRLKTKVVAPAARDAAAGVALVGTYRARQLAWMAREGVYNWPVKDGDAFDAAALGKVGELWLYADAKGTRHAFAATFAGRMTRAAFLAAHPSYASRVGAPTHTAYYVFKTTPLGYGPGLENPVVLVRAGDFGPRTAKARKAIERFQADGAFAPLEHYLPADLARVPSAQLRVCEPGVQMDFMAMMFPNRKFPSVAPIAYAAGAIVAHARDLQRTPQTKGGRPFRLGEFFCGPGGLACGALSARIENPNFRIAHAWANDYDQQTCNTYAENICREEPETVICHDVRKLSLDDRRLTPIDGFAFGFPCNDFSVVGEHRGIDGDYGPLYQYGVAVLRKFQPIWFVAENVGGLASANEGAAFKKILASMKDAGYRIYPHLYKFEEYGVPQSRHRIIIVGIRDDQPFQFFPPSPAALEPRDNSARAALEDPPIPKDAANNERTAMNARVVERLNHIKPGQNAFTADLPERLQLHVRGAKISQIYKRLDPEKPAYTVTGSGGGGTHIYHYAEPRALTNRERARLQTFPDAYLFTGSKESVRKQIGMAVPPRGARIIFEAILRTFAGEEYRHIACNITDEGELRKGVVP